MRNLNLTLKRAVVILFTIANFGILWSQTPIWEENFSGTSINRDVWTYDVSGSGMGNGELQYYTDRATNSYISDGNLVIEAKRENYEGKQFTSARLKTLGRFSFQYGIIEARIKLPDLKNGLWPAFWTMGDNIGQVGWPKCGEIDILEAGSEHARLTDSINNQMSGALHWWHETGTWSSWLQADAAASTGLASGTFYDSYHTYKMVWDSTHIEIWLDSKKFFDMNISAPELSEFRQPHFLLLNLAVGGSNYVNLTDPAQITAPLPAKMLVDYVKIYPIAGQTKIFKANDAVKTGNYGVFTDNTVVTEKLNFATESDLYIWNNMTIGSGAPYEGSEVMNYNIAAGSWWGMGIMAKSIKNMSRYSDGYLNFYMKTSSKETIGIGVGSSAGEGWVELVDGAEQYGLVRNGQWCQVKIPLNRYAVDFNSVYHMFMMKGNAPASAIAVSVDDIYWSEGTTRVAPENGNFGVYTDNTACVMKFNTPADGNFYIWDKTLNTTTSDPKEGTNVLSFTSASGLSWFGASFTPNAKYNLTAFRYTNSKLHFDMKTTSAATFKVGIKSGNTPDVGQGWITFKNGADPYGFVRDGQWHAIEIPMSAFENVDLLQVSQLFTLLGTEGAIGNIAIDNIYYTGGGSAIKEGNQNPLCAITSPVNNTEYNTGANITISATASDPDGTVAKVEFYANGSKIAEDLSSPYSYTWSNVGAGTHSITAKAIDNANAETMSSPVSVKVNAAPVLTSITVSPVEVTKFIGEKEQFSAIGKDQFGNTISCSPVWTVTGSGNTISSSGLLTAGIAGTYTVTATQGSIKGTASVTINPNTEVNIALNKPATSSSIEAAYAASNVNDGNISTRWGSAFADPQWIRIDLQATYSINKVVFKWEAASAKAYTIQVSNDNTNWQTVKTITSGAGGTETHTLVATGRYIRMYGTSRNTGYGYSLYEFEVYGNSDNNIAPVANAGVDKSITLPTNSVSITGSGTDTDGTISAYSWVQVSGPNTASISGQTSAAMTASNLVTGTYTFRLSVTDNKGASGSDEVSVTVNNAPLTNIAFNKPTTSSSLESGYPDSNATDGSAATRWSSVFADPQWITIDLVQTYNVSQVVLKWETASGKNYTIQLSNDNVNWLTIKTVTNGTGGTETHAVTGTGRYLRIYGTERNTSWGYSLWEIEAAGTVAQTACSVLAATGDYSATISSDASNPTITFVPSRTGIGANTCILYYGTLATGTLGGYTVTPNTPYRISAPAGQIIYFYYTYSIPKGGERNTANNRNSFTVGSCGNTLKSAKIHSQISENDINTEFEAFPVPLQNELNLRFQAGTYKKALIFDISGKLMYSGIIEEATGEAVINTSKLQKGSYYIRLIGDNANATKMILK